MSKFMYNNVWVQNARTTQFDMHYERDQSNTDVLWQVYSIRVIGFVVWDESRFPGAQSDTTLETGVMLNTKVQNTGSKIKAALETPRRPCLYAIDQVQDPRDPGNPNALIDNVIVQTGGVVIDPVTGDTTTIPALDAHLGPWPQKASCVPVNSGLFMVECGFDVSVVECSKECASANGSDPVVSLRWTQSESFDDTWHSKISTRGRLVVRSDLMQQADNFRLRCTPPILPDYIRQTAEYTLSPSGTELDFSFVDQEVDFMPPTLAVKSSGRCIIQVKGCARAGQVDLKLQGIKGGAHKFELLKKALVMAYLKLQREGFISDLCPVIACTAVEDLFVNEVTVSMQAKLAPLPGAGGAVAGRVGGGILGLLPGAALAPFSPIPFLGGLADIAGIPDVVGPAPGVGVVTSPDVMPGCGFTPGVNIDLKDKDKGIGMRQGLAPPQRSRLAKLLAAAFRDPCACLAATTDTTLVATGETSPVPNPALSGGTRAAIISVAPLPSLPKGPLVFSDTVPYDHYLVESKYSYSSGRVPMPSTGVGQNGNVASFPQVSGPVMMLVVNWTAQRQGVPPVLPTFLPLDNNFIPLDADITPMQVEPAPDGLSMVYSTYGQYRYGIVDPSKASITHPIPPFLSQYVTESALTGSSSYSDAVLWFFNGVQGPNPFMPETATPGQVPDSSTRTRLLLGMRGGGPAGNQQLPGTGNNQSNTGITSQPQVGP